MFRLFETDGDRITVEVDAELDEDIIETDIGNDETFISGHYAESNVSNSSEEPYLSSSIYSSSHTLLVDKAVEILKSGEFSDVTFKLGTDGTEVKAHKLILSMVLPEFKELLYSEGSPSVITIPDVEPKAFKLLMDMIYSGRLDVVADVTEAYGVYSVAEMYKFKPAMAVCEKYVSKSLTSANALASYEFSHRFGIAKLMNECMEYACVGAKDVLADESFCQLKPETVTTFFDNDLNVDTELELVNALERYWENFQHDTGLLRNAVGKIRFLLLTPEEFSESRGVSKLLSQSDSFALLTNIITTKASVGIPEDLSKNKEKRSSSFNWNNE